MNSFGKVSSVIAESRNGNQSWASIYDPMYHVYLMIILTILMVITLVVLYVLGCTEVCEKPKTMKNVPVN
uniref:Uncharacterized protein n=1 Tax=Panagrolaimus sp. JU765 TaxID=591449 RepID=A0AC34R458_9BILA